MAEEGAIRASKNGPYLIPGSLLLVGEGGNPTENAHKTNGFTAPQAILALR